MKLYFLFCNGSRGDCEPAICIAQYMLGKGDNVCIFSNEKNIKLLKKSGIKHKIIMKNYINKQPEEVSPLQYFHEFKDTLIYHLDQINSIEEKPDAVIGMGDQLGKFLAEKFKVPYYQLVLQYYHVPSYASNKSYLELTLETLERWYRIIYSKKELEYFNNIRKILNLEPVNDFIDYIQNNENVYGKTIVANSLILSNFNYIKHEKVFISGNINLIVPLDKSIDEVDGLVEFMNDNTNYVYLNLGSMSQKVDDDLFNLYQEAFNDIDCKVIISCNREKQADNKKFFFCSSINQHELFKKINLIIQCGGLGTVFKAAYYGVPQLIIPKNFEEPFWAEKFKELGCGYSIEFKNLTAVNLSEAVNYLLSNKIIKHNANVLSKSIDINGVESIYKYIK